MGKDTKRLMKNATAALYESDLDGDGGRIEKCLTGENGWTKIEVQRWLNSRSDQKWRRHFALEPILRAEIRRAEIDW